MILIISGHDDDQIHDVAAKLKSLGEEYFWFDPADFPTKVELRLTYDRRGFANCVFYCYGREMDLTTVKAVWNRRPGIPQAAPEVHEEEQRNWISQMSRNCLNGVWETLNCLWVPAKPSVDWEAHNKVRQLALAASLGFKIPRTLITNSPKAFLQFYSECDKNMVTKVLGNIVVSRNGEPYGAFTHVVRRRDIARFLTIRYAPVILQEYVSKEIEIRVTVVGTKIFAAEINSQASRATRHDWRHYDHDRATYKPHELPQEINTLCCRLVQALGLCFGAIDLVLTPEGEYVFLEINPNGQWGWIQDLTDLPIAEAIAQLLADGTVAPTEGK